MARGRAKIIIRIYNASGELIDVKEFEGNTFLICGVNSLWNIIAGNITSWDLGICVGDGTTAVSNTQTCLQGSNQACSNASSVNVSDNQLIVTAQFGGNEANFSWNEACVAFTNFACADCTFACIDRLQQSMGIKQPGTTWQVTMILEIT